MNERRQTEQDGLTAEELAAQEVAELPDREAMSLLSGSLFNPSMPTEGADLLGQSGTDTEGAPSTSPDLSSSPVPLKGPFVG